MGFSVPIVYSLVKVSRVFCRRLEGRLLQIVSGHEIVAFTYHGWKIWALFFSPAFFVGTLLEFFEVKTLAFWEI